MYQCILLYNFLYIYILCYIIFNLKEKSKDDLISEIKELKSIIHKSTMSLNVDGITNIKEEEKDTDKEDEEKDTGNEDEEKESESNEESKDKVANKSITINTKFNDHDETSTMCNDYYY